MLVLHLLPLLNPYLVNDQNLVNLSLFYRYYFGRCSSALAELVPLSYSCGRSTHYSNRLPNISIALPRSYEEKYVYVLHN